MCVFGCLGMGGVVVCRCALRFRHWFGSGCETVFDVFGCCLFEMQFCDFVGG